MYSRVKFACNFEKPKKIKHFIFQLNYNEQRTTLEIKKKTIIAQTFLPSHLNKLLTRRKLFLKSTPRIDDWIEISDTEIADKHIHRKSKW